MIKKYILSACYLFRNLSDFVVFKIPNWLNMGISFLIYSIPLFIFHFIECEISQRIGMIALGGFLQGLSIFSLLLFMSICVLRCKKGVILKDYLPHVMFMWGNVILSLLALDHILDHGQILHDIHKTYLIFSAHLMINLSHIYLMMMHYYPGGRHRRSKFKREE